MKLLDRTHGKHATERALDTGDHELLEQLEVPDDLSGIEHIPSIGEDRHEPVAEPRRAAPMVRWLGWVSVYLLAMAGLIVGLAMLSNGGDTDPVAPGVETPDWETEGPGSPSLDAPWLSRTQVPWGPNQGPGGDTPNLVPVTPVVEPVFIPIPVTGVGPSMETHGPGGVLPDMTWTPAVETIEAPWSFETGGPGSNSL